MWEVGAFLLLVNVAFHRIIRRGVLYTPEIIHADKPACSGMRYAPASMSDICLVLLAFCLFFMALNEFPRRHAELFLEALAEVRRVIKTYHVAYLTDVVFVFQQERSRLLQPD